MKDYDILCLLKLCIERAFLVGQTFPQNGHPKPPLSICLASTCPFTRSLRRDVKLHWRHCHSPVRAFCIFCKINSSNPRTWKKRQICTCIWSCIQLARILVFSRHVHSKGFPGFTHCSTMETLNPTTTDVLGLTVVLQVMFMNRAELAIKATPQAIRIPCQALLYQFIQPCSQEVRWIYFNKIHKTLCFLELCIDRAFLVGHIVPHTSHETPWLITCFASTWLCTLPFLLELKLHWRQNHSPEASLSTFW